MIVSMLGGQYRGDAARRWTMRLVLRICGLMWVACAACAADPAGRVANSTLRFPPEPPQGAYGVARPFGDLTFQDPVCVKSPPGETNRLFVVERTGRILVVTNLAAPTRTVCLDLSGDTVSAYVEAGLLGLAFHPGYASNRTFYVFRTAFTTTTGATNLLHDVLSRFEASPADPNLALPNSERR